MTILGKKQMSEEDIKLNYITPVILKGWKGHITMETKITDGRINIRGNIVARSKPKFADYSFRISLYIANFLGENEAQAQQIFKQVRKMYSSRSSAVHGNKTKDNLESAVEESANLLTRILRRCAELNKLPDVDNLAFRVDKQTKARH